MEERLLIRVASQLEQVLNRSDTDEGSPSFREILDAQDDWINYGLA